MDKKQLYYVVGGVAVIGIIIGLYLYKKNKKADDSVESEDLKTKSAEEKLGSEEKIVRMGKPASIGLRPTSTLSNVKTKLTQQQIADRLAICGNMPTQLSKKLLYRKCRSQIIDELKSQGLIESKPVSATAIAGAVSTVASKLTEQELADRLAVCGKKPKLKSNQKLWHECRLQVTNKLKSQGLVAFDGSYSFEGLLDNDFFSGFDSNFDLNL